MLSGSNDGSAGLFSLSRGGARYHRFHSGEAVGVDAVCLDLRTRTAVAGAKNGNVYTYDIETGNNIAVHACSSWIWCLSTGTSQLPPAQHELGAQLPRGSVTARNDADSSLGDGSQHLGDGRYIFAGSTDGIVRLIDTRERRTVQESSNSITHEPISGLAPMLADNRFVTTGFDGATRVWDTRRWQPVATLTFPDRTSSLFPRTHEVRLTRCDVTAEAIMTCTMDGNALCFDMRPDRSTASWTTLCSNAN